MAIFMDNGGGDIYAAETKEACIEAMLKDDPDLLMADVEEVDGSRKMRLENEDGSQGELVTIESEYTNLGYGYCICQHQLLNPLLHCFH